MFSVYYGRDRLYLSVDIRYCITCLNLSELVVLEPLGTDVYLEAKVVGHVH